LQEFFEPNCNTSTKGRLQVNSVTRAHHQWRIYAKWRPWQSLNVRPFAQFSRKINQETKCTEAENMYLFFIKTFQQIKYKLSGRTITVFCTDYVNYKEYQNIQKIRLS